MKMNEDVNTSTKLSIDGERNRTVKSKAQKRINIIKGQLDGLLKMIDQDQYCIDVLNQSLAIQNSIKSLDSVILEKHLKTHVSEQFIKEKEKAVGELLKLFRRVHE